MHDLIRMASEVVRLLPTGGDMTSNQMASRYVWTPPRDFREICACQRHARQERALWRRALRVARRRGVALLVTVPLAFGAIGIEAMNISLPALAEQAMTFGEQQSFPVLTRKVREAFLNPEHAKTTFTLDVAKEEF